MKNFEALAVGVIAGLAVSCLCQPKPTKAKPKPCEKGCEPCKTHCRCKATNPCRIGDKSDCKKCYYQRYYR
ncbi:MAG: hypothetical protein IKA61_01010 [Clostridia bacterium]|nr:hypothetical protein [Clostridia bacterium]MBR2384944.1 hypothetical protein [Clostridia bacterium]